MTADPLSLAKTVQARLGDDETARTLVDQSHRTIEPARPPSSHAMAALEALRALGATLGARIDLHQTIGEGGMGVVHLATQATLGRHVAVKTLRVGKGDEEAALRILREAWVTGLLEHPNIVPIHDVGVDSAGKPIIVMKRIAGRPWSALMRDATEIHRQFQATDAVEWNLRTLASVCNAVLFAHSRGILHRDLKPDNVMIGEFGEVYVLDWGIAVSMVDDPSGRLPLASQATEIAGTPQYMAPEMLLGDPTAYSPRTDVYLLGAILFEIFAGEPPHTGNDFNALVTNILLSNPVYTPAFPTEVRRICAKALAREPGHRFETAEAFRLAIEEYLRHRGSLRLTADAEQRLVRLQKTFDEGASSEQHKLTVAKLLGECRFGYHAALSAWPGNEAAREGLDRALLLVIERELGEGNPSGAAALLREVVDKPAELVARVEATLKAKDEEERRLRKMGDDLDPTIGTRTRMFLGVVFGIGFTLTPLAGWAYFRRTGHATYFGSAVGPALAFLVLGLGAFLWARQTMMRTALNRGLALTFVLYMACHATLGVGAWIAGVPPGQLHMIFLLLWALTYGLLAVWAERLLALPALACAIGFIVTAAYPSLAYVLMAFANVLFTIVLVKVWLPRQDVARLQEQRRLLRARARSWLDEHGAG